LIDFVKILVEEYDGSVLKKNPLLDFHGVFKESTGEAKKTFTAKYKDLKFTIHESDNINTGKSAQVL